MLNHSNQIIDGLGGTSAVSRMTETSPSTVHSWRKNGIPKSRLAHLRLVADRDGIALDWVTGERLDHPEPDTHSDVAATSGKSFGVSAQAVSA